MARLQAYIALATVQAPVVFTSTVSGSSEIGFLYTTSPYIHNYPVMYSLMDRPSEAAFVVSSKQFKAKTYSGLEYKSIRRVVEALARGEEPEAPYAYPLLPVKVGYVTFHTTMLADSHYIDIRGKPKTYAPRNQNYVAIAPGSRFLTLILSPQPLPSHMYGSIGLKRLGILRFDLCRARVSSGGEWEYSNLLVNEGDMRLLGFENGEYILVYETRTRPSWNPGGNRISWYAGPGQYVLEPERDKRCARVLRKARRYGEGGRERWVAPLPPRFAYD
ncbi:MAG: hypothetical protein LRS48_03830 [Desulfurococcales archaeon]|nr:hypothetical protein [Desulfurococcales archaeon]